MRTTPAPVTPEPVGHHPHRRSVLVAGLATPATLAGLASCGNTEGSSAEPADTSAGAGSADSEGEATGGSGGASETLEAALVSVGMAVYLESSNTVVTQPSEGEYHAFDATCPHQGCAVNQAVDGELKCPCHGSTFDLTSGEVLGGPAQTGLTEREVSLDGEELVVGEGR